MSFRVSLCFGLFNLLGVLGLGDDQNPLAAQTEQVFAARGTRHSTMAAIWALSHLHTAATVARNGSSSLFLKRLLTKSNENAILMDSISIR